MQETGLPEIIPLICAVPIRGQNLVFTHPESPQEALLGVAADAACLMAGILFPS